MTEQEKKEFVPELVVAKALFVQAPLWGLLILAIQGVIIMGIVWFYQNFVGPKYEAHLNSQRKDKIELVELDRHDGPEGEEYRER